MRGGGRRHTLPLATSFMVQPVAIFLFVIKKYQNKEGRQGRGPRQGKDGKDEGGEIYISPRVGLFGRNHGKGLACRAGGGAVRGDVGGGRGGEGEDPSG